MSVRQERAIQTRRRIVLAAASVFGECGFDAASVAEILTRGEITKGAMYFHFSSKEDLARAVLSEQTVQVVVPLADSKVQELVDVTMRVADAFLSDPVLRASARLSLEQASVDFSANAPFPRWAGSYAGLLAEGKEMGEVLARVDPAETADFIVGSFTGIQAVSRISSDCGDLSQRVSVMWQHVLPAIVMPDLLNRLDVQADRGRRIAEQIAAGGEGVVPAAEHR